MMMVMMMMMILNDYLFLYVQWATKSQLDNGRAWQENHRKQILGSSEAIIVVSEETPNIIDLGEFGYGKVDDDIVTVLCHWAR